LRKILSGGYQKMTIIYKDGKPVAVTTPEAQELEAAKGPTPQELEEEARITRRRFMRNTFLSTMTAFTIGGGATFLLFFWPKKVGTFGSKIAVGALADYPEGSVTKVSEGRFWLVHLRQEDGGGFMALYWKCVHLGCTVPWEPDESGTYEGKSYKGIFKCPCHGSLYIYNGQNFGGPAPRPLDYMDVSTAGGRIVVDTGKIIKREKHNNSMQAQA
jgi:cytochrome b6-f complex iron-sulfur subunit